MGWAKTSKAGELEFDIQRTLATLAVDGASMDSPVKSAMAKALATEALRVVRFEFGYISNRRAGGRRRPPPRAEHLVEEYRAAVRDDHPKGCLIIAGSMVGRVASMVADDLRSGGVSAILRLGYLRRNNLDRLGTEHLKHLKLSTLFCQETCDPFGTFAEVSRYEFSPRIEVFWLEDGDHDLRPRKSVSGINDADRLATMA